jgi:hypothetical protein
VLSFVRTTPFNGLNELLLDFYLLSPLFDLIETLVTFIRNIKMRAYKIHFEFCVKFKHNIILCFRH